MSMSVDLLQNSNYTMYTRNLLIKQVSLHLSVRELKISQYWVESVVVGILLNNSRTPPDPEHAKAGLQVRGLVYNVWALRSSARIKSGLRL